MVCGAFGRTGIITICVAADVTLLLHLVTTDKALARFASRNRGARTVLETRTPAPVNRLLGTGVRVWLAARYFHWGVGERIAVRTLVVERSLCGHASSSLLQGEETLVGGRAHVNGYTKGM
jgi:hypothetical protein